MTQLTKKRPKYLNLFEIKLPIAGYASILHRVSGLGMFLMLPLLIWLLDRSLHSAESFQSLQSVVGNPLVKLVLLGLLGLAMRRFGLPEAAIHKELYWPAGKQPTGTNE